MEDDLLVMGLALTAVSAAIAGFVAADDDSCLLYTSPSPRDS